MNKNWGYCDLDKKPCFGAGAICRNSPKGERKFHQEHKGQGKKEPARNKDCSRYKKTLTEPSEQEKVILEVERNIKQT